MDKLEVNDPTLSPVKTMEKKQEKRFFDIKDLKYSLPLTSNQIFKMLKNNNSDIIESLPEVKTEKDSKCLSRGMRTKKLIYNKRCKGCQIIYRLTTKTVLEEETVPIHTGDMKGSKLKISSLDHFSEDYQKTKKYEDLENYVTNIFFTLTSKKIVKYTKYEISNQNINSVIVSNLWNRIMEEEKFRVSSNYLWNFVCGRKMYTMTRDPSILTLEELLKDSFYAPGGKLVPRISTDIIFQLVQYFKIFQKYSISVDGDPREVIGFQIENLEYNNKVFPIKLVMKPGSLTCIQYMGNKYFVGNQNVKNTGSPYEDITVFLNGTDSYLRTGDTDYHRKRIVSYKVGNKYTCFKNLCYHTGIDNFSISYDFVSFLTYLLRNSGMTFQERHHSMWRGLWMPKELPDIKKIPSDTNLRDAMRNFHVRFDALDYWSREASD